MSIKNWTPKVAALGALACAITILFVMGVTAIWKDQARPATWFLLSGAGLAFIFFRNRKIAFAIVSLSFLAATAGLNAVVHPTAPGLLVTFGSLGGIYLLAAWQAKKYPNLKGKDWKSFFDRDPE
jgi:hypothetical protein